MLAQRQEEEKQRHIRNFLFLRLVKDVLKHERSVEYVKQVLFSHKGFSVHDAFRFLDVQQRGEISATDLEEVFAKHNLVLNNASLVVDACDVDDDATIDYKELENAISPAGAHNLRGRQNFGSNFGSFEQQEVQRMAWIESLHEVLEALQDRRITNSRLREKAQVDAEAIF